MPYMGSLQASGMMALRGWPAQRVIRVVANLRRAKAPHKTSCLQAEDTVGGLCVWILFAQ